MKSKELTPWEKLQQQNKILGNNEDINILKQTVDNPQGINQSDRKSLNNFLLNVLVNAKSPKFNGINVGEKGVATAVNAFADNKGEELLKNQIGRKLVDEHFNKYLSNKNRTSSIFNKSVDDFLKEWGVPEDFYAFAKNHGVMGLTHHTGSGNNQSASIAINVPRNDDDNMLQTTLPHEMTHFADIYGNQFLSKDSQKSILRSENVLNDYFKKLQNKYPDRYKKENEIKNYFSGMKKIVGGQNNLSNQTAISEIIGHTIPEIFNPWEKIDKYDLTTTEGMKKEGARKILRHALKDTRENWGMQGLKDRGYTPVRNALDNKIEYLRKFDSKKLMPPQNISPSFLDKFKNKESGSQGVNLEYFNKPQTYDDVYQEWKQRQHLATQPISINSPPNVLDMFDTYNSYNNPQPNQQSSSNLSSSVSNTAVIPNNNYNYSNNTYPFNTLYQPSQPNQQSSSNPSLEQNKLPPYNSNLQKPPPPFDKAHGGHIIKPHVRYLEHGLNAKPYKQGGRVSPLIQMMQPRESNPIINHMLGYDDLY